MKSLVVTRVDDDSAPNQEYKYLTQSETDDIENDRRARAVQGEEYAENQASHPKNLHVSA